MSPPFVKGFNMIQRINRTLKYQGAILDIYSDKMRLDDGSIQDWDFVSHRMGAAAILPVLRDGKILLVEQSRPCIEKVTLEIPAGCRDYKDEDAKVCAMRELKEETGYESDDVIKLLTLNTTVAFCDETVEIFMAKNIKKVSSQKLDAGEDITIKIFEPKELVNMIFSGNITDSKTIAAIMSYQCLTKHDC